MSKTKAKFVKTKKSNFWPKFRKGLRALLSNQACVELRESKWYAPVIIGLLSVFVAVVPTLVNNLKLSGSDILASPTVNTEIGLNAFAEKLDEKQIDVVMDPATGTIALDETKWNAEFPAVSGSGSSYNIYSHVYEITEVVMQTSEYESDSSIVTVDTVPATETKKYCDLAVYNLTDLNSADLQDAIIGTNNVNKDGLPSILAGMDPAGNYPYTATSLFLGAESFVLVKSPQGTAITSSKGYREYHYASLKQAVNLRDLVREDPHGVAYEVTRTENVDTYMEKATAAWSLLLKDAWNDTRINSGLATTGMWLGIYAAAVAFLGLMIFLFTRGKNNPLSIFTFWQSETIVGWATMSPAILALALGFFIKRYASLMFIILFGVRILWMVFRSLRPVRQ